MASKDTLRIRADISMAANKFIRRSTLDDLRFKGYSVNESGEIAVVPSGPDESIAIAIHRIQKTGEKYVVLATEYDGHGRLMEFECSSTPTEGNKVIDLPGRVTVREWFNKYAENHKGLTFSCSGSEFGLEISALGQPTLMDA